MALFRPTTTTSKEPRVSAPKIEIRRHSFPLTFRLGEMYLTEYNVAVAELVSHFLECPVSLADALAFDPVAHGAVSTLARSVVLGEPMPELSRSGDRFVYRLGEYRRHFVDLLSRSYDEYQATFSSKSRSTLLRKIRKFEARSGGRIDWATFRTADEVDAFFHEALPLSQATYQHRLLGSGLPAGAAFREQTRKLAERNQFRGWLLRQDGKAVAYIYSPAVGRALLYEYVGFDAAVGDQSPGTVLQVLVLRQLMLERQFTVFDFTEGEGPHKEFFGSDHRLCADVLILPDTWRYRSLVRVHRSFSGAVHASVALMARLGLKEKLKRIIRRAA